MRQPAFTLFTWLLDATDAGNTTVTAPATATTGGTANIGLSLGALTPGVKYPGSVAYSGAAGMPNPTIVRVDPWRWSAPRAARSGRAARPRSRGLACRDTARRPIRGRRGGRDDPRRVSR